MGDIYEFQYFLCPSYLHIYTSLHSGFIQTMQGLFENIPEQSSNQFSTTPSTTKTSLQFNTRCSSKEWIINVNGKVRKNQFSAVNIAPVYRGFIFQVERLTIIIILIQVFQPRGQIFCQAAAGSLVFQISWVFQGPNLLFTEFQDLKF